MTNIYEILKLLKEEFKCFEVDLCLAQVYEQEGDEVGKEVFHVVLFSELCENPIEINLSTDEGLLSHLNIREVCNELKFELSCQKQITHELYLFGNKTLH